MSEVLEKKKKEKPKKPKGPIRTGAVIPFLVISLIVVLFNLFLLDSTIKKTIEFAVEQVNGAEVNVSKVTTSLSDLKIEVGKIQITDKNAPAFNMLQVGKVDFQLMWDALLRGKIVIDIANIEDILLNTKRSSAGEVFPVERDEKTGNSKATQELLNKTKKEFDGNVFGDIAGIMAGGSTGDVTKNIAGTLESKKKFDELNTKIKDKEKSLSNDFKNLPGKSHFASLQNRFKAIRWKDLGNLVKAPKILKEADQLNKDFNKAIKSYDKASKNLSQSVKEIDKSYKEAEALISKDISSVSQRMNLPKLDQKSIAKVLFGNEILDKVSQAKKYQTMAEKYMPPKKEKQKPVKVKRGKGRNYQFGKPNSYPLFWLKLAKINSKNDQGSIEGKLENVTNDQVATGKLTTATMKADFPGINVHGVNAKLTVDHRKEPKAVFEGKVNNFLVLNKALSDTKSAKFIIKKSQARATFRGTLKPKTASIIINNEFKKIQYITDAKNSAVKEVLADVAKKTKRLTLDAKVKGKWDSLKFEIKSNLAAAIQNSVQDLVQQKINKAKKKIKDDINKQIASSRAQVDKQVNDLKSQYNKQLNDGKKQLNNLKGQLASAKKKAKKEALNPFKGFKL